LSVYRVNWLRAKARHDRWNEEKHIVEKEMVWTTEYFRNMHRIWAARSQRAIEPDQSGLQSYAEKQMDMWASFADQSLRVFAAGC